MASSICATNWSWATAKYAAPIAQSTTHHCGGQPHPIRLVGTAARFALGAMYARTAWSRVVRKSGVRNLWSLVQAGGINAAAVRIRNTVAKKTTGDLMGEGTRKAVKGPPGYSLGPEGAACWAADKRSSRWPASKQALQPRHNTCFLQDGCAWEHLPRAAAGSGLVLTLKRMPSPA